MLSSGTSPDLWICVPGSLRFSQSLKGGRVRNNMAWGIESCRKVCVFMRTVFDLVSKKHWNFFLQFLAVATFFTEGTCHVSRLYESAGLKDGGLKGNSQWAWLKRLHHRLPSASHLGLWLWRWNLNARISGDPFLWLNVPFYTGYVYLTILLAGCVTCVHWPFHLSRAWSSFASRLALRGAPLPPSVSGLVSGAVCWLSALARPTLGLWN